jgi:hypothetical protein
LPPRIEHPGARLDINGLVQERQQRADERRAHAAGEQPEKGEDPEHRGGAGEGRGDAPAERIVAEQRHPRRDQLLAEHRMLDIARLGQVEDRLGGG